MTARPAADWLIAIGWKLEQFKAEDASDHSAHVDAWLSADACEKCGNVKPLVQRGLHPRCEDCMPDRDEEPSERERQRAEEWGERVFGLRGEWD